MLNDITHTQVWVLDQDKALEFYVGTLGLEVRTDLEMGPMRWLTVAVPGRPGPEIVLLTPGGFMPDDHASAARAALAAGVSSMVILTTDDAQAAWTKVRDSGATVLQEPVEQFYGTDFAVADPFGNHIRITQLAAVPGTPLAEGCTGTPVGS